ncbi:hypothetical protein C8034_v011158 [Colletotrichum sidae]|uniref:Uncharacterized protein n=1 Tax=Colletotrichum sidae TaxID=1347389 RepID=A0A4R8TK85_9PEZI|nr:hypothetical protein C8034_v011158 [Colletotrichum sidae]
MHRQRRSMRHQHLRDHEALLRRPHLPEPERAQPKPLPASALVVDRKRAVDRRIKVWEDKRECVSAL